ncbi:hypothetical protein [Alkalihalobacillus sp. TS-13]|uniref:hypothetical protein n=1 Tax=Alkalihalobacillus sp. TS-13 TaxID=2842455 RepID=UPI001C880FCB|nr:hypothetical protein [Alkalihalobacillus sp. TS-13]
MKILFSVFGVITASLYVWIFIYSLIWGEIIMNIYLVWWTLIIILVVLVALFSEKRSEKYEIVFYVIFASLFVWFPIYMLIWNPSLL